MGPETLEFFAQFTATMLWNDDSSRFNLEHYLLKNIYTSELLKI